MFKAVEDLQKFTRSGIEATTQSAAVLSRGFQQIATEASSFSKKAIEDGSNFWGRMIGVSSWESAIQTQTDYARSSYEGLVAEYAKVGEIMASVTKDAYRPFESAFEQVRPR